MDDALDKAKLAELIEIEGYDSIDELMEAVFSDAVSPAICMNEGHVGSCDPSCRIFVQPLAQGGPDPGDGVTGAGRGRALVRKSTAILLPSRLDKRGRLGHRCENF